MHVVRRDTTIQNMKGLHARAAAKVVKCAGGFASRMTIVCRDHEVPATSIIGLMMLAAGRGTPLTVVAEGADADDAVIALVSLIDRAFDEE